MPLSLSASVLRPLRTGRRVFTFLAWCALVCAALPAQTNVWTGNADTLWGNPANWTGGVPNATVSVDIPAGAPRSPTVTTGASCLDLTIDGGAVLNIPTAVAVAVNGNFTNAGTVTGFGEMQMVGATTNVSVASVSTISRMRVSKSGGASISLVGPLTLGTLTQLAGLTYFQNQVAVSGQATFLGGSIGTYGGAQLTVAFMSLANTTVTGAMPDTFCTGNWSADGAFQAPGNTVTFPGGNHSIGGTAPHFTYLNLAPGSIVTVNGGPVDVAVDLTAGGILNTPTTVNVGSNANISGSIIGAGSVQIGGGVYNSYVNGSGSVSHLVVAKTAGLYAVLNGGLTCGTLALSSGDVYVGTSGVGTTTVTGTSAFTGGTLHAFGGDLVLNGDVTITGTAAASGAINITAAGNWTATSAFAPDGGLVTFTGTGKTIGGTGPAFASLAVAQSASVTAATPVTTYDGLTVDGSLVLNADATVGSYVSMYGTTTGSGTLTAGGGTFDGTLYGGGNIPHFAIAKTGGHYFALEGGSVGGGNHVGTLSLLSGDLYLGLYYPGATAVSGASSFTGGILHGAGGVLDLNGDVSITGTTVVGSPVINAAGNWTAPGAFTPTGGTVTFTGSGRSIGGSGPSFCNLVIAAGANIAASGPIATYQDLTVSGTLAVNVSATVGASLNIYGTTSGGGTITATGDVFDGYLYGGGTVNHYAVAKTGGHYIELAGTQGAGTTTCGTFALTSGDVYIGYGGTGTTTVIGASTFAGGVLHGFSGTLNLNGNVAMTGTTASGNPVINAGGNWSGDSSFAPTDGIVRFVGTTQAISGSAPNFCDLTVTGGSTVTVNSTLAVYRDLLVSGSMNLVAPVSVGEHTQVTGNVTGNGTLTMSGSVFDGWLWGSGSITNVAVAKGGGHYCDLAGSQTQFGQLLCGSLILVSGPMYIGINGTGTTTVTGSAVFYGGSVNGFGGVLNVSGDVTCFGAAASSPDITCHGNWTADDVFNPGGGTITLNGVGNTTISPAGGAATMHFGALTIANARRDINGGVTVRTANSVTINAGGAVAINSGNALAVDNGGIDVDGQVLVSAGGELLLGSVFATFNPGSLLSLVGTLTQPAVMAGTGAGFWFCGMNGTLAANHFMLRDMYTFYIPTSGIIAAAPNDFHDGVIDGRLVPAGVTALTIDRVANTTLNNIDFIASGPNTAYQNVTTSGPAQVFFHNWGGSRGGQNYENDPLNLIGWGVSPGTVLNSFDSEARADSAVLAAVTSGEVGALSLTIDVATRLGGPYATVYNFPPFGSPHVYQAPVYGLPAGATYYLRMTVNLGPGNDRVLGLTVVTPYSSALPPNVLTVGPNGNYATIQSAIDQATGTNAVVRIAPGVYAPFAVTNSQVANLRIVGDGTGPVTITTVTGPARIDYLTPPGSVEINGLTFTSGGSPTTALSITNCEGPVILTDCTIIGGPFHPGLSIDTSTGVALQGTTTTGLPGLLVNSSIVSATRGSSNLFSLTNGAGLTRCEFPASTLSIDATSTDTAYPGVMPHLTVPLSLSLATPFTIDFVAAPNTTWILILGFTLGYVDELPYVQLPALLDPAGVFMFPAMYTDGSGHSGFPLSVPPDPAYIGVIFTSQAAADTGTGPYRFSNVATHIALP